MSFSICLISLSRMHCGSIHVAANGNVLLFFTTQSHSIVPLDHDFFIHPPADRRTSGCVCVLVTVHSVFFSVLLRSSFHKVCSVSPCDPDLSVWLCAGICRERRFCPPLSVSLCLRCEVGLSEAACVGSCFLATQPPVSFDWSTYSIYI